MNKICLNKLCEFSLTSYINNYNNINYSNKFNFEETLNSIKQNSSLNENIFLINFNFKKFNNIIKNNEKNELLLLNPLSFNIYENKEWYNFLNALLLVLNEKYIYENKIQKKNILEKINNIYSQKINFKIFSENIIEKICESTLISIIIIDDKEKKTYNLGKEKYVILYKYKDEYYPFINWDIKYFYHNSEFVEYLLNNDIHYKIENTNDN